MGYCNYKVNLSLLKKEWILFGRCLFYFFVLKLNVEDFKYCVVLI